MTLGFSKRAALCALCTGALIWPGTLCAQDAPAPDPIAPVSIDEAALSGLDLARREIPDKPDKEFYQKRLYRGETLSVFALGGERIENVQTGFPIDEYVQYINGHADIEADGQSMTLLAGDYAIAPKGWAGIWTNNGGPRHHLELSVISTKRSEAKSSLKAPFRMDRAVLAGLSLGPLIEGRARQVVYDGPEITVSIVHEEPQARTITADDPEVFVHILNGSIILTPETGAPIQYFLGDSFVLPTGFVGTWSVEGLNGLRIVEVVAKAL